MRVGAPLALFDVAGSQRLRRLPAVVAPLPALLNLAVLFVLALLLTPLVRPVRATRLLLTYLVPAIPLLFAWDGTVSALRAYLPEELLALARSVPGAGDYEWNVAQAGLALCLTGCRRPRPTSPVTSA